MYDRQTSIMQLLLKEKAEPLKYTKRQFYYSKTEINMSAGSSGKTFLFRPLVLFSLLNVCHWKVNFYFEIHFRFRHGYCKGNPRKMVRTWAEKEMRNLIRWALLCLSWTYVMMLVSVSDANAFISRLQTAQIPSPEPIMLRSHVLVMSFIGRDDMYVGIYRHTSFSTFPKWYYRLFSSDLVCVFLRPAPLLKNAVLSESKARELYMQIIQNMRIMYNEARLVHADLSEFNIL